VGDLLDRLGALPVVEREAAEVRLLHADAAA
jgi:hypothetical protein